MITILKQIKKSFGSMDVLKGIDLTIEEGEFVAIVGPSGCGKTTLLRILAGFEKPTSGLLMMDDQSVAHIPPEQRNISLVFQSFALWPHMKVKDQIAFPLKHHRFVESQLKENMEARVAEMLDIVSLNHLAHRYPHELSGGQKQRVAIARALSPAPALILMDEPLSSLDAKLRIELRNEIQTIHRTFKKAIVYVTHDQSEALAMADKIVVMNEGKIEQVGTPQAIYFQPETPFVATFIGKANLIKGIWEGDYFYPDANKALQWHIPDIPVSFKNQGICPIRPEQFKVKIIEQNSHTAELAGFNGIVRNVQFQGREVVCGVQVGSNHLSVVTDTHHLPSIGQTVLLNIETASSTTDEQHSILDYICGA